MLERFERGRDLRRREADIAIRSFRPTQPDLVAKKIRDVEAHLYASPCYVERVGPFESPDDLSGAEFLGFDETDALRKGLEHVGLSLTADNFPIISANHLVLWELVKAGVGIGVMQAEIGDAAVGVEVAHGRAASGAAQHEHSIGAQREAAGAPAAHLLGRRLVPRLHEGKEVVAAAGEAVVPGHGTSTSTVSLASLSLPLESTALT